MIKKSISRELRDKIIKDIKLKKTRFGHPTFGMDEYEGVLFFNPNEMNLLYECKEWLHIIDTYFLTSYNAYRIKTMGKLEGIRPKHIFCNRAEFTVVNKRRENWKDWFVQDGADLNLT